MSETLFREKSLQKIQSPDDLNEYITVSKPSVWIILLSVLVLLIGTCIWGIFGTIVSKRDIGLITEKGDTYCIVHAENVELAQKAKSINIEGTENVQIKDIDYSQVDEGIFIVHFDIDGMSEGNHTGEVILDVIHPFDFLTN